MQITRVDAIMAFISIFGFSGLTAAAPFGTVNPASGMSIPSSNQPSSVWSVQSVSYMPSSPPPPETYSNVAPASMIPNAKRQYSSSGSSGSSVGSEILSGIISALPDLLGGLGHDEKAKRSSSSYSAGSAAMGQPGADSFEGGLDDFMTGIAFDGDEKKKSSSSSYTIG